MIFIWLLFFHNMVSIAQKQNKSIIYNSLIQKAESLILSNDFKSAIIFYDSAKSTKQYFLAKDKMNNAICYLKLGNKNSARKLLLDLLKDGAKKEWLLKKPIVLENFQKAKFWKKKLPLRKTIDKEIRETLENVFNLDQKFRLLKNSYSKHMTEIRSADSLNFLVINNLIKKLGCFPNEELIGVNDETLINQPFYIHIYHQTPGYKKYDYADILLSALKNSDINPYVGASLFVQVTGISAYFGPLSITRMIYDNNKILLPNGATIIDTSINNANGWLTINLSDSITNKLDSIRLNYSLEPIEIFEKKVKYQMNDENFLFYCQRYLKVIFSCKTKQDAESLIKYYRSIGL